MNTLGRYKEEKRLSNDDIAKQLQEKLGRKISATGVEMMLARQEAPVPWLNALGISPKEPSGQKDKKTESNVKPTSEEIAPTNPLPFEPISARATIELIYTMAGKGASMATRTPEVATAWENASPNLAEAWIDWAKENKTVANGIAMLTVGGPGGQVILMNASLLISTLMLIQQHRGVQIIPPGFETLSDEDIRARTEGQVDEQLRNSPPPG